MPAMGMGKAAKPARLLPGVLLRVLPFTVLVLLSIWLLASNEATRTVSDQLEQGLENEANEIAKATSAKLTSTIDALTSLAGNDFIINALVDVEDRHNYLPTFFRTLRLPGTFDARVTLTDYRGRRIESNGPGRSYKDEPWVEKVMAGENVIVFSRDVLLIAVPVWQFQQPDGAMVMELFSVSFWSFLDLFSASHVVEVWGRDNERLHIAFDRSGNSDLSSGNDDAAEWVRAEAAVPDFPNLRSTVRQREAIAFAPAKRLHRFLVVALFFSFSAIVAGIAATAYFATKPLGRFVAEIDKVGEAGGLGYRIASFGSAEFHGLSQSLNQMLETLQSTTTSRNYFNGVFNSISEILIVTDTEGLIHLANWAATDATGWSIDELKQRNVFSIVQGLTECGEDTAQNREGTMEVALTTARGSSIPVQVSVSHLAADAGKAARKVYVFVDITERKRAQEELAALAQFDILTGIANRSLFQRKHTEAVAQAKRTGQAVALMLLDLDNFKDVNDTLGHPAGDALLVEVAERLTRATRETDTVARLGGDEFAIVLTNLHSADDAETVAAKLIESMNVPFDLDGRKIRTGVSIGISVYPPEEPDTAKMFNHADFALYQSKSGGKGTFDFFDEDMNNERQARRAIEADLARAIELEQFELYYQPKLSAISGEIIGAEALIRWRHPERGMVPPIEFIPIAESTGKIAELSTWVLKQACKQHVEWRDGELGPIPIAVNLSPIQFRDGGLGDTIKEICATYGVEPAFLELEITESTIIDKIEDVSEQLAELHKHGHKLFVDDFGTGYSSLSYLSRFPIDALKIDRSFVAKVIESPHEATITKAIIGLARSLDMGVIAEGVETEEQLAFLRRHGCPEVQGYLFSRPLPAAEFSAWFRAMSRPPVHRQIQDAQRATR